MSKQDAAVIAKVVQEYGKDPHRLMDIVRGVHEQAGYLSDDAVDEIAKALGVHRVQVVDMASFYTFFDREPAGKCTIRLSNCVVDQMHGMEAVVKAFEKELGIAIGETTPDGMISLKYTSCTGMCDQAPGGLINGMVVTGLAPKDVPEIVAAIKKEGGRVSKSELFPNAEVQLNLRQGGAVIMAPFENGAAVRKALNMSPEDVIE